MSEHKVVSEARLEALSGDFEQCGHVSSIEGLSLYSQGGIIRELVLDLREARRPLKDHLIACENCDGRWKGRAGECRNCAEAITYLKAVEGRGR